MRRIRILLNGSGAALCGDTWLVGGVLFGMVRDRRIKSGMSGSQLMPARPCPRPSLEARGLALALVGSGAALGATSAPSAGGSVPTVSLDPAVSPSPVGIVSG